MATISRHPSTLQSKTRSGLAERRLWQSSQRPSLFPVRYVWITSRKAGRQAGQPRELISSCASETPTPRRKWTSIRMTSASTRGSFEPSSSALSWLNWRNRPFCGRSRRNMGPMVKSLTRVSDAVKAVLQVGPHDRGRCLGPHRQGFLAAVREGVHLFFDDVRRLTDRALEELRLLQDGENDLAEPEMPKRFRGPFLLTKSHFSVSPGRMSLNPLTAVMIFMMHGTRPKNLNLNC